MSLKIHTLIRHVGCSACTEVEENYLDLESSVGLMHTVGEVVRRQAERAHGPVRVHNFSLAEGRRRTRRTRTRRTRTRRKAASDTRSAFSSPASGSLSTVSGTSSIETGTSEDDEPPLPPDELDDGVPGNPAEPASGDDHPDDDGDDGDNDDGDDDYDDEVAEATRADSQKRPRRLCNITAVVDWNTPPEAKDALANLDMLRLLDDECRELQAHLRSRAMCDLIVLEYRLEP